MLLPSWTRPTWPRRGYRVIDMKPKPIGRLRSLWLWLHGYRRASIQNGDAPPMNGWAKEEKRMEGSPTSTYHGHLDNGYEFTVTAYRPTPTNKGAGESSD